MILWIFCDLDLKQPPPNYTRLLRESYPRPPHTSHVFRTRTVKTGWRNRPYTVHQSDYHFAAVDGHVSYHVIYEGCAKIIGCTNAGEHESTLSAGAVHRMQPAS